MSERIPAVSVVIPAWGVAHLVGETLASLEAQTFTDWEALVVDDGAPDDVGGAVRPFAERDSRIRFMPTPHGGLSAARNHGIAAARAPLIAILDGDDTYTPDYLEKMVAAIKADSGLGFVSCDAIFTGQPSREGKRFSAYNPQTGDVTLENVLTRRFNVCCTTILRREAIAAVGGFDEELWSAEDLDMWIRILAAGWRAGSVKEPLVMYRRRPGSLSSSPSRLHRAVQRVYEKSAANLAGRPEGATAAAMLERVRETAEWSQGEDLIIGGQTLAGLDTLRRVHAERRNRRWRLAMLVFSIVPPLARPVMTWRRRQEAKV